MQDGKFPALMKINKYSVMKKNIKWAAALMLPFAVACQDDLGKEPVNILGEGEDVEFVVAPMSRTMYADDQWDAENTQQLYWGNYISTEEDNIKIFCRQASRQIATYKVNLQTTGGQGSSVAESITKVGEAGVQWGAEGTAHNFYAFYPAENAGDAFVGTGDNTIRASVDNGQSSKAFRAVVGDGTTVYDGQYSLADVQSNSAQNTASRTTIYAQPDMSSAIMVAKTPVAAADYGKPVPLHFNVLADVLDIAVNGPIVPNQLGGNAAGESRNFITIYDVSVYSNDGTKIAGTFDLNMETGEAANISNGSDRILLQLSQTGDDGFRDCPVLHARVNNTSSGYVPTAGDIDHLRVRAFLIPGVVKNLNQLKVVVSTDCGDYTQVLGDDGMVSGQIHRIKLGYFHERGKSFDYTKWISQLDPTIYVTELSLPGTWHSTDDRYQGSTVTLAGQFEKGIRAFETHAYITPENPTITTNTNPTWVNGNVTTREGNIDRTPASWTDQSHGTMTQTYTFTRTQSCPDYRTVTSQNYTVNNSAGNSMLTGLTALSTKLNNSGEFAVLEVGSPKNEKVTVAKVGSNCSATRTQTYTITRRGTYTRSGSFLNYTYNYTWSSDEPTESDVNWADATTGTPTVSNYETVTEDKFVLGMNWLMEQLVSSGANIYTKGITPTTTIGDVKGKFILKINTNGEEFNETGWIANAPALFSRWSTNAADGIGDVALQWGASIAPEAVNPTLHWIYSELDNIDNHEITNASIASRKKAVDAYEQASIETYNKGTLGYWFMISVGGFTNETQTAENCQDAAKQLNPYLLNVLTKSTRTACPMGLLYFNCALMDNDTYYGESLIRTIINNNGAFPLRRAEAKKAADNTNAHFVNDTRNPLKP